MTTMTEAFPHRRAGHCGSGALRDLLEYSGLDYGDGALSEGSVFGMAAGLGFLFLEMPGMQPPFYLVGRTGDMERDVAAHLDAGLDVRECDDPATGWSWVADEIDAGRPTMVWADIAELEYLRVKMTNTRHDVVVVDYDLDQQVAWIADNDRDELQRCSLTALAAARNSTGFPGPNRHQTFVYDWPARLPHPSIVNRRALRRAITNMRDVSTTVGGLPGPVGLQGIDAFAQSYPRWPALFDQDVDQALGALSVLIVKAGTGGAMFRSLHARYLRDFGELLSDRGLLTAADVYDQAAASWRALAQAAREGEHHAGLALVTDIQRLEHDGVAAMEHAL